MNAGTVYGFVYWDSSISSHLAPSICGALAVTVSVADTKPFPSYTPLGTQSKFVSIATVQPPLKSVNTTAYDGCAYSFTNVPVGQSLQVKLSLTQTVGTLTPAVVAQDPPVGPIQISNTPCNKLPPLTKATVADLTGNWGSCQNVAYDVNFPLISRVQITPLSASGGSGGTPGAQLQANPGPVQNPAAVNPGPTQRTTGMIGTPGQANPGPINTPLLKQAGATTTTLLNNSSATSSPSGGMLSPANNPAMGPMPPTQPAPGTPGQLLSPGTSSSPQAPPSAGVLARAPVSSIPAAVTPGAHPGQNPAGGISQRIPPNAAPPVISQVRRANELKGFVDLHTHPLSNLAFGGKLIYGGVDIGSLLPADPNCNHNVYATSVQQALGHDNSTHGGWGTDNGCGDDIRAQVIHGLQQANKAADPPDDAYGAPDFKDWPVWNDITHQKMWVDWIYRSYLGGLRVMVALAVNNKTLGDATAGPGDYATDDKSSADRQIQETKKFVARHSNFMQIAYSSADVQNIVKANKLAVVLGVEIDNIGNLNQVRPLTPAAITAEISRLYAEGVRYIFPIHIIDNPFGGTAVYEGAFNISNYQMNGKFWDLECSNPSDNIGYVYQPSPMDIPTALVEVVKLHFKFVVQPGNPPACSTGDENQHGLTRLGEFAIKEMMRRGMLIDIDHMSQKSANRALDLAEGPPTSPLGYPLFSGHNTPRGAGGNSENQRTPQQYARIAKLGGMAGVGTAGRNAYEWLQLYQKVVQSMNQQSEALGTDLNGLVEGMPPRQGSQISYSPFFPKSSLGTKQWDYNTDGVPHYGMLPEFLMDAKTGTNGTYLIDNNLMYGAETFFEAWQKCESLKGKVN
jgi:microsomal dipeptidase-like Zn-dependent dipeptidase